MECICIFMIRMGCRQKADKKQIQGRLLMPFCKKAAEAAVILFTKNWTAKTNNLKGKIFARQPANAKVI